MKWIEKIIEVKGFTIQTLWNDGSVRSIDLENYINKKSENADSSYSKIKELSAFSKVKCDGTTLYWEGLIEYRDTDGTIKPGNLDISPELLYDLSSLECHSVV